MGRIQKHYRKTAPKVKNGKVQKKNNQKETPTYWNTAQRVPVIDKEAPGHGFKHYLRKRDILEFIDILPEWDRISEGLNAVVLARAHPWADGLHHPEYGVIKICAWERDKWTEFTREGYEEHRKLLNRLEVSCEKRHSFYMCKFDEKSIKAYQLLHVFLHELGHHHDMMTTRSQLESSRGESYAEEYALKYEKMIFNRYFEVFGY